jgi:hypothetical protein
LPQAAAKVCESLREYSLHSEFKQIRLQPDRSIACVYTLQGVKAASQLQKDATEPSAAAAPPQPSSPAGKEPATSRGKKAVAAAATAPAGKKRATSTTAAAGTSAKVSSPAKRSKPAAAAAGASKQDADVEEEDAISFSVTASGSGSDGSGGEMSDGGTEGEKSMGMCVSFFGGVDKLPMERLSLGTAMNGNA